MNRLFISEYTVFPLKGMFLIKRKGCAFCTPVVHIYQSNRTGHFVFAPIHDDKKVFGDIPTVFLNSRLKWLISVYPD